MTYDEFRAARIERIRYWINLARWARQDGLSQSRIQYCLLVAAGYRASIAFAK